jgi:ribosome-associated toxin RatA of RatAB toxin-antitoxin module
VTTLRGTTRQGSDTQFGVRMPGRRGRGACQVLLTALIVLSTLSTIAPAAPQAETAKTAGQTDVAVREKDGIYHVAATFTVAQTVPVVFAVLTGYEQIPRYMPDVRSSRVIERSEGHAVVEQEAVARVMMFSKRVHLVLDVREESQSIRFRDRCGKSFDHYEGAWTLAAKSPERVEIRYELAAKPSFDVPEFLLKRLFKRDAQEMIRRLQDEMTRPR